MVRSRRMAGRWGAEESGTKSMHIGAAQKSNMSFIEKLLISIGGRASQGQVMHDRRPRLRACAGGSLIHDSTGCL